MGGFVSVERQGRVAIVRLDRTESLCAIDSHVSLVVPSQREAVDALLNKSTPGSTGE